MPSSGAMPFSSASNRQHCGRPSVASGAVFAIRVGRRADYVTLILVATAVMVAVEPAQLWRLSFQLSLASSVALAVVLSGINPAGLFGWLEVALLAAVAAQLATLPVLLPTFDTLSLVSVPANLLIGPLVGVAFPLAALAGMAAFVWFPLGEALVLPARLAADGVLAVVDTLSSVGGGALTPGAFRSPARWLVAAVAAAAVTALSRDGRAWAARLPGAVREARPEARLAAAALLAGATLGIAVRILG